MKKKINTPIRWHGAKWRIANWVINHFPEHFTYVEPFGGSAAVLLTKAPSGAEVYNDLDSDLCNFYEVVRNHPDALMRQLGLTPYSREEYLKCWSKIVNNEPMDPIERARSFVVASFQARGSVIRRTKPTGWRVFAKKSTFGQTPGDQWMTISSRIESIVGRLSGVQIENKSAFDVMKTHDSEDTLFYLDPPYPELVRKEGLGNYQHEMCDNMHIDLADKLSSIKGMAAISGYDCPLYQEIFKDWECKTVVTRAEMNAKRVECLWLSPSLSAKHAKSDNQVLMFA